MCGIICGELPRISGRRVEAALESLKHRGPDSAGTTTLYESRQVGEKVVSFGNVFFGHTRLAIVGVDDGHQPLLNEDGSIVISVNGEFYDTEALRAELEAKGHVFKTASDSEVLLHLYEEYGTDCLQFLHGEFAFALYDRNRRRWFCARDRAGVRPLQYHFSKGKFVIASEAKALFAMGVRPELDRENVWFSQHLQYLPLDGTLFKGVTMIQPAHFILVENGQLSEHRYWSLNDVQERAMTFDEARERAVDLLTKAVARRIPHEVRWACHLSGGIDSSIVSALAQRHLGGGHCFTVKFTDDAFYDETPFARDTAKFLGATLHEVPASFSQILDRLPDAIYHAEGLSINGHLGAKNLLNQAMRAEGFKVAFTGEGADELFMGYSHLKQDFLSANSLTTMENQYLAGVQLPSGPTLDLSEVQRQLGFVPTWVAAKSSMANRFQSLWAPEFKFEGNPYAEMLARSGVLEANVSALKKSSSLWMQYCLSGYILKVLDDAQAMAHGIEGRLPFLDTALMEFMWSVPNALHFTEGLEKNLLRKGFAAALPRSVLTKTKQSFMSPPVQRALKDAKFKAQIQGYLLDNSRFYDQGLFARPAVEAFLNRCATEDGPANEPILMTLLSLALICEKFEL